MTLSNEAKQMLVRRLAWYESPRRPLRQHYDAAGAVYEAITKTNYTDSGDARRRKENQRLREELQRAGLLAQNFITDAGKRAARLWTWAFPAAKLREAIDRIGQRAKAGDCRCGGYVPETLIAGVQLAEWPEPFEELQALLMPAVADGVIETNSTLYGDAYYRLPPNSCLGSDAVAVADEPEFDAQLFKLYDTEYGAVWRRILNDQKKYCDFGSIPLPVSGELESGRDPDDLTKIKPLFPELSKGKK